MAQNGIGLRRKASLKQYLKERFPRGMLLKREVSERLNRDRYVLRILPFYKPNSSGKRQDLAKLTIECANQVFPALSSLFSSFSKKKLIMLGIRDFANSEGDEESAKELKVLLDKYGSDKANYHDYHYLYGAILRDKENVGAVLEVGLGTNNIDLVSNMGATGRPGASLRAFRDFLPRAKVFGADIDKGVLFSEERIETFYVDQTDPSSLDALSEALPDTFDLIIDDGLHSPNANVRTLTFGLRKIKPGGWVVIEDIHSATLPAWEVVAALLPSQYESYFIDASEGCIFAVKRTS
jgi:SAM-dependent methyltransferase